MANNTEGLIPLYRNLPGTCVPVHQRPERGRPPISASLNGCVTIVVSVLQRQMQYMQFGRGTNTTTGDLRDLVILTQRQRVTGVFGYSSPARM